MSQTIYCQTCSTETEAANIADLIGTHTDEAGRFRCASCSGTDTFIELSRSPRRRAAPARWVRGIVPIDTKTSDLAYTPFVFLTADVPEGDVTGIEFRYYRNAHTRGPQGNGGRKPNGGPVLGQTQLLALVGRLAKIGVVAVEDWRALVRDVDGTLHAEQ